MGTITIVGLGPGAAGNLSLETMDLLKSEAQVILRTAVHPTVAELEKQNVQAGFRLDFTAPPNTKELSFKVASVSFSMIKHIKGLSCVKMRYLTEFMKL